MTGSRAREGRTQAAQARTRGCPPDPHRQQAVFDPSSASSVLPYYRITHTPARRFHRISITIPPFLHEALEGRTGAAAAAPAPVPDLASMPARRARPLDAQCWAG